MSLAIQSLVGLTLLICGAVTALPEIAHERRPRSQPLARVQGGAALWLVQAPGQRWYLGGQAIESGRLASLVRRQAGRIERRHGRASRPRAGPAPTGGHWYRAPGPPQQA